MGQEPSIPDALLKVPWAVHVVFEANEVHGTAYAQGSDNIFIFNVSFFGFASIPLEALGEQYKETFTYALRRVCIFDGNLFEIHRPGAPAKKKRMRCVVVFCSVHSSRHCCGGLIY